MQIVGYCFPRFYEVVFYEIPVAELLLEFLAEYCVKGLVCPFGSAMNGSSCRLFLILYLFLLLVVLFFLLFPLSCTFLLVFPVQVCPTPLPKEYLQCHTESKYPLDYLKKVLFQFNLKSVL